MIVSLADGQQKTTPIILGIHVALLVALSSLTFGFCEPFPSAKNITTTHSVEDYYRISGSSLLAVAEIILGPLHLYSQNIRSGKYFKSFLNCRTNLDQVIGRHF